MKRYFSSLTNQGTCMVLGHFHHLHRHNHQNHCEHHHHHKRRSEKVRHRLQNNKLSFNQPSYKYFPLWNDDCINISRLKVKGPSGAPTSSWIGAVGVGITLSRS